MRAVRKKLPRHSCGSRSRSRSSGTGRERTFVSFTYPTDINNTVQVWFEMVEHLAVVDNIVYLELLEVLVMGSYQSLIIVEHVLCKKDVVIAYWTKSIKIVMT